MNTGFRVSRRQALAGLATIGLAMPARAAIAINLGVLRLESHAPGFIAYDRGYFNQEGLAVTLRFFEAAQPLAVAIASHDVDFGVTAMSGGLISLAEKGAIKVMGGALAEEKGIPGAILLASNKAYDSGLTSPSKLAGRSFGITTTGSSFHYMAAKVAQASGVAPSSLVLRPLQKLGALVGALSTGQIDAWVIQPNIARRLIAEGAARQIGLVADTLPDYQVTVAFGSTANVAQDRAKTQAFLRAYSRGVDDYNAAVVDKTADDAEVRAIGAIVHRYVDADAPAEAALANFVGGAMRINKGMAMSMHSLLDQLDWFKTEGMVKPGITPEMLFDTTYVKIA